MRTLVTGWFSFDDMGASAGDLIAKDVVCGWLDEVGTCYDVAFARPFLGGPSLAEVVPSVYDRLIFVCGPFGNGPPITEFLPRFAHCQLIGLNLSMLDPLEAWNPFDVLIERDSSRTSRPDLTMLSDKALVPIVGLVLIDAQPEYEEKDLRAVANQAFDRLIESREMAIVRIDTRLDQNGTGLRTPSEIESLIARMDVVLTTRLHGLVLSLKNGVPAIAIDSVKGGHKVWKQAVKLGWPLVFHAEDVTDAGLKSALSLCLSDEGRAMASRCRDQARKDLRSVRDRFFSIYSLKGE